MATRFCNQCGNELAEGKSFCGRCGAVVAQRTPANVAPADTAPDQALVSTVRVPPQERTLAPQVLPTHASPVQLEQTASVETSPEPVIDDVQDSRDASTAETIPSKAIVVPAPNQPVQSAHPPSGPLSAIAKNNKGSACSRIGVTIAAALFIVVGSLFGLYEWHSKAITPSPNLVGGTSTPASQEPSHLPVVETLPKPDAGIRADASAPPVITEPSVPPPSPLPTPAVPAVKPPSPKPRPDDLDDGTPPPSSRRVFPPASASAPAPIERVPLGPPRSGVLHYAGPPVHLGESVTFSGLPSGMLRFSFDHSAWLPRIIHQPDGTQSLVLKSLTQQQQLTCDVRWEVAQ